MSREFSFAALRIAVGHICQNVGWHALQQSSLNILVDILHRYIVELGKCAHAFTNEAGRTETNTEDVFLAFHVFGITQSELLDYLLNVDSLPFPHKLPAYPVEQERMVTFAPHYISQKEEEQREFTEWVPPAGGPPELFDSDEENSSDAATVDDVGNGNDDQSRSGSNNLHAKEPAPLTSSSTNVAGESKQTVAEQDNVQQHQHQQQQTSSSAPQLENDAKRAEENAQKSAASKKLKVLAEEGTPMREVILIQMTPSGFLSAIRDGRLPDPCHPSKLLHDPPDSEPPNLSSDEASPPSGLQSSPLSSTAAKAAKKKKKVKTTAESKVDKFFDEKPSVAGSLVTSIKLDKSSKEKKSKDSKDKPKKNKEEAKEKKGKAKEDQKEVLKVSKIKEDLKSKKSKKRKAGIVSRSPVKGGVSAAPLINDGSEPSNPVNADTPSKRRKVVRPAPTPAAQFTPEQLPANDGQAESAPSIAAAAPTVCPAEVVDRKTTKSRLDERTVVDGGVSQTTQSTAKPKGSKADKDSKEKRTKSRKEAKVAHVGDVAAKGVSKAEMIDPANSSGDVANDLLRGIDDAISTVIENARRGVSSPGTSGAPVTATAGVGEEGTRRKLQVNEIFDDSDADSSRSGSPQRPDHNADVINEDGRKSSAFFSEDLCGIEDEVVDDAGRPRTPGVLPEEFNDDALTVSIPCSVGGSKHQRRSMSPSVDNIVLTEDTPANAILCVKSESMSLPVADKRPVAKQAKPKKAKKKVISAPLASPIVKKEPKTSKKKVKSKTKKMAITPAAPSPVPCGPPSNTAVDVAAGVNAVSAPSQVVDMSSAIELQPTSYLTPSVTITPVPSVPPVAQVQPTSTLTVKTLAERKGLPPLEVSSLSNLSLEKKKEKKKKEKKDKTKINSVPDDKPVKKSKEVTKLTIKPVKRQALASSDTSPSEQLFAPTAMVTTTRAVPPVAKKSKQTANVDAGAGIKSVKETKDAPAKTKGKKSVAHMPTNEVATERESPVGDVGKVASQTLLSMSPPPAPPPTKIARANESKDQAKKETGAQQKPSKREKAVTLPKIASPLPVDVPEINIPSGEAPLPVKKEKVKKETAPTAPKETKTKAAKKQTVEPPLEIDRKFSLGPESAEPEVPVKTIRASKAALKELPDMVKVERPARSQKQKDDKKSAAQQHNKKESGKKEKKTSAKTEEKPVAGSVSASQASGGLVVETVGTIFDSEGNKIWICPACAKPDDGSPMIGCDQCDDWYHWECVGISVPPSEEEQWFCARCTKLKKPPNKKKHRK